jgi:alpha-L-arabinofuranosidase
MFGQSAGKYYYGDCVTIDDATNLQGQSVVLNTKTRQLFVKLCNASGDSKMGHLNLSRFKGMKSAATMTVISGQPEDENNYEQQPIAPKTSPLKASKKMDIELAPYSMVMLQMTL